MIDIESVSIRGAKSRALGRSLITWLRAAAERRRQRRLLATLDDHHLHDIGVTREQALAEARRPPWR
ncbi:MAG: DUF1127 domain-containing protein [Geminicoccaceae bacterium]